MLFLFETFGSWLRAIPGPSEHWATIVSAWAWPAVLLVVVFQLREPLQHAAGRLADRFGRDDIELGSWLKLKKSTPLMTLDQQAVTEESGTPEAEDVRIVEALLEYAGESEAHANRLLAWISENGSPDLDAEAFLTEGAFANLRKKVHKELIGEPHVR